MSIANSIRRLQTAKNDITQALNNIGVDIADTDGFEVFSEKIYNIVTQDTGWEYDINDDGTITLTKYIGSDTELIVPNRYIDNGVTYVVSKVQNPNAYRTYSDKFGGDYIAADQRFSITASSANETNTKITSISISDGVEIGDCAFFKFTAVTQIHIGKHIKGIGCMAFAMCSLLSGHLNIPEGVEKLYFEAFLNTSFTEITLPSSLKYIGYYAIYSKDNTITQVNYNCIDCTLNNCGKKIMPFGSNVTTININSQVKTLPNCIFCNFCNYNEETLDLSHCTELTTIGEHAFAYWHSMTGKLILPNSLATIGGYAFTEWFEASGLEFISTPNSNSLELSIGDSAFCNWNNATSLQLPNNLKYIGNSAFQYFSQAASNHGTLTLPDSLEIIESNAFSMAQFTGGLEIPASVRAIGASAFNQAVTNNYLYGSWSGELIFNEGLEWIGDYAFNHCIGFTNTKITLPSTLKRIGGKTSIGIGGDGYSNHALGTHVLYDICRNSKTAFESYEVTVIPYKLLTSQPSNWTSDYKSYYTRSGSGTDEDPFVYASIYGSTAPDWSNDTYYEYNRPYFCAIDGVLYSCDSDGTPKALHAVPNRKQTALVMPNTVTSGGSLAFNYFGYFDGGKDLVLSDAFVVHEDASMAYEYDNKGNLDNYNTLSDTTYRFALINNIYTNNTNPIYTSVNGLLLSKDEKTLFYVPRGNLGRQITEAGEQINVIFIPDTVTRIAKGAFVCWAYLADKLYIPASVTDIADETIVSLNGNSISSSIVKEIDPRNMNYYVDSNGNIRVKNWSQENFIFDATLDTSNKTMCINGFSEAGINNSNFDKTNIIVAENYTLNGVKYTVTEIGDLAFSTYPTVTVDDVAYDNSSNYITNQSIQSIQLPKTVTKIGMHAFSGYFDNEITPYAPIKSMLTSVTGLDNVISVGAYAFKNQPYIDTLYLPNSVTLGKQAFVQMGSLREITLGRGLTVIPEKCFSRAETLVSVSGNFKLDRIESRGFYHCNNLKELNVDTVTYIGDQAFDNCPYICDWSELQTGGTEFGANAARIVKWSSEVLNADYTIVQPAQNYSDKVVGYSQMYKDWVNTPIGESTTLKIGRNGGSWCVLTAAYNALNSKNMTPPELIALVAEKDSTLANDIVRAGKTYLNLQLSSAISGDAINTVDTIQNIYTAIAQGKMVAWGDSGHVTLIYGIDIDNNIMIIDSSSTKSQCTGEDKYGVTFKGNLLDMLDHDSDETICIIEKISEESTIYTVNDMIKEEYDALENKDENTYYFILNEETSASEV